MKQRLLILIAGIIALTLLTGCAKTTAPAATPTPSSPAAAPPQLASFSVTATAADGVVPASLIVNQGANLNIRSFDNDITITNQALGIDTTIPTGEAKAIRVLPQQPGTYTLTCTQGCPDGKNTITLEVR